MSGFLIKMKTKKKKMVFDRLYFSRNLHNRKCNVCLLYGAKSIQNMPLFIEQIYSKWLLPKYIENNPFTISILELLRTQNQFKTMFCCFLLSFSVYQITENPLHVYCLLPIYILQFTNFKILFLSSFFR